MVVIVGSIGSVCAKGRVWRCDFRVVGKHGFLGEKDGKDWGGQCTGSGVVGIVVIVVVVAMSPHRDVVAK